jgi:hypothetical protein
VGFAGVFDRRLNLCNYFFCFLMAGALDLEAALSAQDDETAFSIFTLYVHGVAFFVVLEIPDVGDHLQLP